MPSQTRKARFTHSAFSYSSWAKLCAWRQKTQLQNHDNGNVTCAWKTLIKKNKLSVHDCLIRLRILHITVAGGQAIKTPLKSPNLCLLKLAKQGSLILHFLTVFEPNYAHEGKKYSFKTTIMAMLHVHESLWYSEKNCRICTMMMTRMDAQSWNILRKVLWGVYIYLGYIYIRGIYISCNTPPP